MQLPLRVPGAFNFSELPSVVANGLNKPSRGNSCADPQPSTGEGGGVNEVQLMLTSLKTQWKAMVDKCARGSVHKNLWVSSLSNCPCASEQLFLIPFPYCPKDQAASHSPVGAFSLCLWGTIPITLHRAQEVLYLKILPWFWAKRKVKPPFSVSLPFLPVPCTRAGCICEAPKPVSDAVCLWVREAFKSECKMRLLQP